MSRHEVEPLLHDVVRAANRILNRVGKKSVNDYLGDEDAQDIAERNFIKIGEALMQTLKIFPEVEKTLPSVREFIAFRHVLTHGYRAIDHERVWAIIDPLFLSQCRSLLGQLPA